jgi:hypothetical protein
MRAAVVLSLGLMVAALAAGCHVDWDCDACAAQEPVVADTSPHSCYHPEQVLGYEWDGSACTAVTGCSCLHNCELLYATETDCDDIHRSCGTPDCS